VHIITELKSQLKRAYILNETALYYTTFVNKHLSNFLLITKSSSFCVSVSVPLRVQNSAVKLNGTCNDLIESIKG